jgi:uncharacterized HhH-GPD family protein
MSLQLAQEPEADALLSSSPLALLIGMVLDQQVPLERAFAAPLELRARLGGTLDAVEIAAMDPDALVAAFCARPALHRFPAANARRVQQLCRQIVDDWDGDASRIWRSAGDGTELYQRIKGLPGFGEQKARIFTALLGKQLGVQPPGWRHAAGPFGGAGTFLSVADIVDGTTLSRVRATKQQIKAAARNRSEGDGTGETAGPQGPGETASGRQP